MHIVPGPLYYFYTNHLTHNKVNSPLLDPVQYYDNKILL